MPIRTSQVFDFLERHETGIIERYEVSSAVFGLLRRSLRQIVLKLRDSDDQEALTASDRLRALLSEWLTAPVPFDRTMLDAEIDILGQAETVEARWGSDIRTLYEMSTRAAAELPSNENPVRLKLRTVILDLRSQGRTFKVYCHRRARQHFDSLLFSADDAPIPDNAFLHSVRDYRDAGLFDVLLKVGPLRTRGWGSAPDAVLTAPRFSTLVQVVWSGCSDEPDFGYDPVAFQLDAATGVVAAVSDGYSRHGPVKWATRVTHFGEDSGAVAGDASDLDELQAFREMDQPRDKRPATLVQVDDENGILYPPHSRILSFDPNQTTGEPVGLRILGETLLEGMFVIIPIVGDVDLGGVRAEHGQYSKIWKTLLKELFETDAADLIRRLHAAGLNLVNLGAAIRHWCSPPSTVIHAPQQKKHFEILLQVLGVGNEDSGRTHHKLPPFWQTAWNEVRRSRGEAIQAGFQEHEIVEEQLLVVLRKIVPQIREKALANEGFNLVIPATCEILGTFLFFKVCGIDEGFSVPTTDLRIVRQLDLIDQWRD